MTDTINFRRFFDSYSFEVSGSTKIFDQKYE